MDSNNDSQATAKQQRNEASIKNFGMPGGDVIREEAADKLIDRIAAVANVPRIVEIADLRKRLKAAGFNVKTRTLSLGIHAYITDDNGIEMVTIFTEESMKKWAPVLKIMRDEFAGCDFRVRGQKTFGLKSQVKNA